MTWANLMMVFIALCICSAIIGALTALTDDKVRNKIRLSPSLRKKRKHLND
jgi:hypothetical protein